MVDRYCLTIAAIGLVTVIAGSSPAWGQDSEKKTPNQYEFEEIVISAATADEPTLARFSLKLAADYVEQANLAWWKKRKCVACHTSGAYVLIRPALTELLGPPPTDMRRRYVDAWKKVDATEHEERLRGITPTQMAVIAGGLAEWDAHVTGTLSPETDAALRLMCELQGANGSWGNADCWPPFESSAYHGTTVAAMALATAPTWLAELGDRNLLASVEKMTTYLRTTPPPHDYARVLLLWTSTRLPGLLETAQKEALIAMIGEHQRKDGGWSIRTFAEPQAWGNGERAKKLRAEPEFENPPSDGHQTGLAILVLRDVGIPADDERILRGVQWLLKNQRRSGRWWTRSLNTDRYHFITYSGTCYPLLALAKCGAVPEDQLNQSADTLSRD